MTWGIWNKQAKGWVGFNNVLFHAPSKAVVVAQIDLLDRIMVQRIRMQQEQARTTERAEKEKAGILTQGIVIPGKDGKPIPVGRTIWEPVTVPPSPFEPRRFDPWYKEKLKGQKDD